MATPQGRVGKSQSVVVNPSPSQTSLGPVARNPSRTQSMMEEQLRPMPPPAELSELFEGFMEERCFNAEVREKMRLLPDQRKWTLLCQSKYKEDVKDERNDPQHWCEVLGKEAVTVKALQSLRVVLGGQGKSWLSQFVDLGGLTSLLNLLGKDPSTVPPNFLMDVMKCLKAFMNNKFGLSIILQTPAAVDQIALVMVNANDALRMEVIDLLTVIAWLSSAGHRSVMDALANPKFGRRFRIFVDALTRGDHTALKVAVMTFINAMVNAGDLLDMRVQVRQEFVDLGLLKAIRIMRDWIDHKRAVGDYSEALGQLTAQFDVFEEAFRADKREVQRNGLDLSDVDALLSYLKETVVEDGFTNQFIQVMHCLMTIPSDQETGERIWNNVQTIVQAATHAIDRQVHPNLAAERPHAPGVGAGEDGEDGGAGAEHDFLTYADLKAILDEHEREQANEIKNKITDLERTIEGQRRQLHEIAMEHASQMDELKAAMRAQLENTLKEKMDVEQQAAALRDQVAHLEAELRGHAALVESLKQEIALARAGGSAAAPGADGSAAGVPPPPPVGGGVPPPPPPPIEGGVPPPPPPPPPPPVGAIPPPPPPPLGGVPPPPPPPPPPPGAGGVPPPPPPPPPPGAGGVPPPPPPPPPPGFAGAAPPPAPPAGPTLPPKKAVKPKVQMKPLHWQPIAPRELSKTLWLQLSDEQVELDVDELEREFARKQLEKKTGGGGVVDPDKAHEEKHEAKQVSLIESKRAYNVNIALARFKMSPFAIRDALLAMDDKVLNVDRMTTLQKCAPTPEEADLVIGYDGDPEQLGTAEKFFLQICRIPMLNLRIELSLFKMNFDNTMDDLGEQLGVLEQAFKALNESKALRRILEIVLAMGNYLNGGTPKGGAYGFRLQSLTRLEGTKGADNKMSLIHYLVKLVQTRYPKARDFVEDLSPLEKTRRMEFKTVESEVRKAAAMVKRVADAARTAEANRNDRFKPVMTEFHEAASKRMASVEERLSKLQVAHKLLCEQFGEEPESVKPEELFALFADFAAQFKTAEHHLEQMRVEAEREAKRQREMEAVEARNKAKREAEEARAAAVADGAAAGAGGGGAGDKGAVDGTLLKLRAQDSREYMKMLNIRRKKRTSVMAKDVASFSPAGAAPADGAPANAPTSPSNVALAVGAPAAPAAAAPAAASPAPAPGKVGLVSKSMSRREMMAATLRQAAEKKP